MEQHFSEKRKSRNGRGRKKSSTELVSKEQVRSMIKSKLGRDLLEWNYYSNSVNAGNVNFSGTTYQLSDIPQGDTDSQRGGDSVSLVKLEVNFGFYAGTSANACRLILYQWFPGLTAGSPPSATSLLLTTGSALAPYSPYSVDNYQQYAILYDETLSVSPTEPLRLGKIRLSKFSKRSIQYTSGSASGSSKLFLLAISDDGVATYPTFSFVSKLYFVDA